MTLKIPQYVYLAFILFVNIEHMEIIYSLSVVFGGFPGNVTIKLIES
jgi:hypothetical protein